MDDDDYLDGIVTDTGLEDEVFLPNPPPSGYDADIEDTAAVPASMMMPIPPANIYNWDASPITPLQLIRPYYSLITPPDAALPMILGLGGLMPVAYTMRDSAAGTQILSI